MSINAIQFVLIFKVLFIFCEIESCGVSIDV